MFARDHVVPVNLTRLGATDLDQVLAFFNECTALKCAERARDMAQALGHEATIVRAPDGHYSVDVFDEGVMVIPREHFEAAERSADEAQKSRLREFIPSIASVT